MDQYFLSKYLWAYDYLEKEENENNKELIKLIHRNDFIKVTEETKGDLFNRVLAGSVIVVIFKNNLEPGFIYRKNHELICINLMQPGRIFFKIDIPGRAYKFFEELVKPIIFFEKWKNN